MKIFVSALMLLLAATVCGQDYIIKNNGDEIKAIVKEVNIDNIKYLNFDNPSGPVYTIMKSDVFIIKYSNGTKDVINAEKGKEPQQPESIVKKKEEATPKIKVNQEYLNDPNYKKNRKVGVGLVTSGSILMAGSMPMVIIGSIFAADPSYYNYVTQSYSYDPDQWINGLTLSIVGSAVLGGSIAMVTLGSIKLNRAKDIKYSYQKGTANVDFKIAPSGATMHLKF